MRTVVFLIIEINLTNFIRTNKKKVNFFNKLNSTKLSKLRLKLNDLMI